MEKNVSGENEGTHGDDDDAALLSRQAIRSKSFSDMPAQDVMRKTKSFDGLSEIMEVKTPLSRRSRSVDFLDSVCMNEEVEMLEDQLDMLHSTLQSKDDTISALHQENIFLDDKDFHAQINYLKIECARKDKEIERLSSIEKSFKQTKQVLKDTTWALKIKEEKLKNIKTEMRENYEKRLNELITRLNEREFRITSLHNENLLLQESDRNHLIRIEELSHQVNLLLNDKNLYNQQKEKEQSSESNPKEHKMLQVSDPQFKDSEYYDVILKENSDLKEQLKEKEETVFYLRDSYTQEVNSLQNEVTKSKSYIIELQQMLEGVSTNSDNFPTNQVVKSAVTPLDGYLLDTCPAIQDNDSVDGLDDLNSLTEEISIKNDELSEGKSSSTKQVNHTIDRYEKQIQDLQTLYDQDVIAFEKEKEELVAQVDEMKKKLLNNGLSARRVDEMREEYENQIMELKSLHNDQESQLMQTVSEEIKNLRVENESLKGLLDRLDKQHKDDLVTCRDQLEESFRDEVQYHMNNAIDQQKEHVKAAKEELHSNLKDLQIHHDSLYKDVGSKFDLENRKLEIELDETHSNELMVLHEEKSNLEKKVSSLKEKINELQLNNDNLYKYIDDLKKEIDFQQEAKSLELNTINDVTELQACVQEMNQSLVDIQTYIAPDNDNGVALSNEMNDEVLAIENFNLHEDIQLLRAKLDETKRDVQNLVNERDNFSVLSNNLNVELNTLKSDLEKNQKLELDQFQEALDKLNEEHQLEVNQLEIEIQNKEKKLQSLENQLRTELNDMLVVSEERLKVSNSKNLSELRNNLDKDYHERLALLEEQMLCQRDKEIEEANKKFAAETEKLKNDILSSFKSTLGQSYVDILQRIPEKLFDDTCNLTEMISAVNEKLIVADIQEELNSLEKLDSTNLCDVFLKKFDCLLKDVQDTQSSKYQDLLNEKMQIANEKHQCEIDDLQLKLNNLQVVIREKDKELETSLDCLEVKHNEIVSKKIKELNEEQDRAFSSMESKFAEKMIAEKKEHENKIRDLISKHKEELEKSRSIHQEQVEKLESEIEYFKENQGNVQELNNEITALEAILQNLNGKLNEATSNRIQFDQLQSKFHSLKRLHSTEKCHLVELLGEFSNLIGKSKIVVVEAINDFQLNVLEYKEGSLNTISKLYSSLILENSMYELKVDNLLNNLQQVFQESFDCQQLLYSNMEDKFHNKMKELISKLSALEDNFKILVQQKPQQSMLENVADEYVILDLNNPSFEKGYLKEQNKSLVGCQTKIKDHVDQFVQTESLENVNQHSFLQQDVDNMKIELMKQHEMLIEEFAQEQEKEIDTLERDYKERILQLNVDFLDSIGTFKMKIMMYLDNEQPDDKHDKVLASHDHILSDEHLCSLGIENVLFFQLEESNGKKAFSSCEKEFEKLFEEICTKCNENIEQCKNETTLEVKAAQTVEQQEKGISVNLDSQHQQQIDNLQKDNSKLFMCLENLLNQLSQSENTIQKKLDYFINKYEPSALKKQNDDNLERPVNLEVIDTSSSDIQPDSLEQISDAGLRMETVLEKMLQLIDMANDQLDENYALYENLFAEHNELLNKVKTLNVEKDSLSEDLNAVTNKCDELEKRLEEVIEHDTHIQHRYEEALQENNRLTENTQGKMQDLLSMQENISALKNQNDNLKELFERLQQDYTNEQATTARLSESVEKQFEEVHKVNVNLSESAANCEALEQKVADLQNIFNIECEKNVELQQKINVGLNEFSKLEHEYNSLKEEYNDYQNNQAEILEKIGDIQHKYEEILSENIKLKEHDNAKEKDLSSMKESFSTLQEQHDVLKESCGSLQECLIKEQSMNTELKQSVESRAKEVQEISSNLAESMENYEALEHKVVDLQNSLNMEHKMNVELHQKITERSNELLNLETEYNSLREEYNDYQNNQAEILEKVGDIQHKYEEILSENIKLKELDNAKEQDLSSMKESFSTLQEQHDVLKESFQTLERSLTSETNINAKLHDSLQLQTRHVKELTYDLEESLANSEILKNKFEESQQYLNKECEINKELQKQMGDKSNEVNNLKNELNSLKMQYAVLQNNENDVLEKEDILQQKYQKLLYDNDQLKDDKNAKTQELSHMQEKISVLKNRNNELEESYKRLNNTLSNEQCTKSELLQSFDSQAQDVEHFKSKLLDSFTECKKLKDEISELQRLLNNERKVNIELQQKVNDTSEELSTQLRDLTHSKQLCHDLKKECATHEKSLLQASVEIKKLNECVKSLSHDVEMDITRSEYINREKLPEENFDNAMELSLNQTYNKENVLIKDTISIATLFDLLSLIEESVKKSQTDNFMDREVFQEELKQSLSKLIRAKCFWMSTGGALSSKSYNMADSMNDDVANPFEVTSRVLDTVNILLEQSRLQATVMEAKDVFPNSPDPKDRTFISVKTPQQEKKLNATIETLLKDIQEEADNVLDLVLNQSSEEFIDAELVRGMQERWKQEKKILLDNIQTLDNLLKKTVASAEKSEMELRNKQRQLANELQNEKIRNGDILKVLNEVESKAGLTVSKLEDQTLENKILREERTELAKTINQLKESLNTEKLLKNHERKQLDDERVKCKTLTDTLSNRTKRLQRIKDLFGDEKQPSGGSKEEVLLSDIEALIKDELKKQALLTERLKAEMDRSKFLNNVVNKQKAQLETTITHEGNFEKQDKLRQLLNSEKKKQQSLQAMMERSDVEMQHKINQLQSINEQLQDDVDELLSHSLAPDGNSPHESHKEQDFDVDNGNHLIGAGWTIAKVQRLYLKYFRAESFRRALCYQKRYLCLLLKRLQSKYQLPLDSVHHRRSSKPNRFKSVCFAVIAINRMRYLVRKYQRNLHKSSANYKFNKRNYRTKHSKSPDCKPSNPMIIDPTEFHEIKSLQLPDIFDPKSPLDDPMTFYEIKPYRSMTEINETIGSQEVQLIRSKVVDSSDDSGADVTLTLFQHTDDKPFKSYLPDPQLKYGKHSRFSPVSVGIESTLNYTLESKSPRKSDINDILISPPSSYPRSTNQSYHSRDKHVTAFDKNPISSLDTYIKKLESLQQRLKNS